MGAGAVISGPLLMGHVPCVDEVHCLAMTPDLADCVLMALLLLHEELSQDVEAPWYVGTPDQTQVLHDELWRLVGELCPDSSSELVEAWYEAGRSALLPVHCTGPLFSSRHLMQVS
jgi:hypothetical protein